MFKYYKKQFIFLLKSELINTTECIIPETEKGKKLKDALKNGEITESELSLLKAEFLKSEKGEVIDKTKKEKADILKCSLENGIKFKNSNYKYYSELLQFIERQSNLEADNKVFDELKKSVGKTMLISTYNGKINIAEVRKNEADTGKIATNNNNNGIQSPVDTSSDLQVQVSTEKIDDNTKKLNEINEWYKNSPKKPNYTTTDKEALKKIFGIENIDSGVTEEQFNKIVAFQKENGLEGDGKIGKETLRKVLLQQKPSEKVNDGNKGKEKIENQPTKMPQEQTIENQEVVQEQTITETPDLTEEQEKFYDSVETQLSHTKLRTDNLFPKIRDKGITSLNPIERKWIDDFDLDEGIGFNSIEIDPKTNDIILSFDDNFLNEGHNKEIHISNCIKGLSFDKLEFLRQIQDKAQESISKYQSKNPEEKLKIEDLPSDKEISDEENERFVESIKTELGNTKVNNETSYFDKSDGNTKNFNIGQKVGFEDIEINLEKNELKFSLDDDLESGKKSDDLVIKMNNLRDQNGLFNKMEFFVELAKQINS